MSPRPSLRALLAAALVAVGAAGCDIDVNDGSTATLTYTEDARSAYNEAMVSFNDKEWEDAKALMQEVKRLFAYSRYARLAELRIADVEFEQEKYTDAIAAYREFIQNHRSDREVEYAKYRINKALFLDIDDTILLPPAEERDQATALEAFRELRAFLKEFPRSRYRLDAAYMLEVVTGRLVRHDLYVARYYLKVDVFEAAVARCDHALKSYAGSGLDAEALVLKGETLLKMKRRDEARKMFLHVIQRYPGPFATTARDFLDEMREQEARGPVVSLPPPAPRPAAPPGGPAKVPVREAVPQ